MEAPESFSFDWIVKSTENRKVECLDFYTENGWDIVLLRVQTKGIDGWVTRFEAGNPLLGGVKSYSSWNTAEKYFFELLGRVHRDAEIRKAKEGQ